MNEDYRDSQVIKYTLDDEHGTAMIGNYADGYTDSSGYQETEDFMSNEGKDIHLRLFSSFSTAVLNASSYNKLCEKATGLAATSFPLLYENIKEICGEADLSHNQKLLSK